MAVSRIQHVSLEVDESVIAEEVSFWEILGFTAVDPPGGIDRSAVWLAAGDQQLHLLPTSDPTVPSSGHLALVAGDYETAVRALGESGFEVVPGAEYWGSPRAKTTSPSGHLLELMEAPPA